MAGHYRVPQVPGLDEIQTLLDIFKDTAKYAAHVKELTDICAEIEVRIEDLGGAEEIDNRRIQAASDRKMAAEELASARGTAAEIRSAAQADIAAARLALETERRDLSQRAHDLRASAAAADGREQERQKRHKEQEAGLASREAQSAIQMSDAQALKTEYEEKLAKLRAAGVV